MSTDSFAGEVRHPIDVESLGKYLEQKRPEIFSTPLTLKQFGHGQSNPSYLVIDAHKRKYVLRKKPPGELLSPSSHRIDREYYIMQALARTEVPVPQTYLLCEDSSLIGTPFYIMQFMEGRIFHSPQFNPDTKPEDRTALWRAALQTLATIHSLDVKKLKLPPNIFNINGGSHFPRQMRTLTKISEAQVKGSDIQAIPHFKETVDWLNAHMPGNTPVCIVHGDYKIDNLVYHPTENRIIGLLDFELCTIGHPLADVGNLLQPFDVAQLGIQLGGMLEVHPGENGALTLSQALAYYASQGVYDPRSDWKFGMAYTHLRLAVILQGVAARSKRGQASSAQAGEFGKLYPTFGNLAYNATKELQVKL